MTPGDPETSGGRPWALARVGQGGAPLRAAELRRPQGVPPQARGGLRRLPPRCVLCACFGADVGDQIDMHWFICNFHGSFDSAFIRDRKANDVLCAMNFSKCHFEFVAEDWILALILFLEVPLKSERGDAR